MPELPHIPVLADPVVRLLARPNTELIVDGTLGSGGHALLLLDACPNAKLVGIDRDPQALALAAERLRGHQVTLVKDTFDHVADVLKDLGLTKAEILLFDIGVSSMQLDQGARGFTFREDAPLDMRMGDSGESAADLMQRLAEDELADVIYRYGEERLSRRIARGIKDAIAEGRMESTTDLASVCRRAYPRKYHRIDPATRTFQALRIAVNDELGQLERMLTEVPAILAPGGRIGVISFHSLEDRIVKETFRKWKAEGLAQILTKKPITADEDEMRANARSRSAKLRVAEWVKAVTGDAQ